MPMDDHTITNELIEIGMKVHVRPGPRFYIYCLRATDHVMCLMCTARRI
jgi:hypothetical protein